MLTMGGLTAWLLRAHAGPAFLPDLLLGSLIVVLDLGAAKEVWEVAETEGSVGRRG